MLHALASPPPSVTHTANWSFIVAQLANRLYGVTVKLSQQQLPVWHPDVEVYELYDTNSTTPMAFFYADLYARPGTKQSGAWVQPISDRAPYRREASPAARAAAELRSKGQNISQLYSQDLAKQQAEWLAAAPLHLPVAVLVSNQNPPTNGKPSLMSMDDAETLFHEFGHALQAMLTRVKEPLAAGMR
jgi:oligopeptidase A